MIKDPNILLSVINTKLRDTYSSINELCIDLDYSKEEIKKLKEEGTDGANVLGAHLEGPFISPKAIGAQNPNFLLKPSIESYEKIVHI